MNTVNPHGLGVDHSRDFLIFFNRGNNIRCFAKFDLVPAPQVDGSPFECPLSCTRKLGPDGRDAEALSHLIKNRDPGPPPWDFPPIHGLNYGWIEFYNDSVGSVAHKTGTLRDFRPFGVNVGRTGAQWIKYDCKRDDERI